MNYVFKLCIIMVMGYRVSADGFYWKEFTGIIPTDAFVANGDIEPPPPPIYVGNAPWHGAIGLYVGELLAGRSAVTISVPGLFGGAVHIATEHISILCGTQDNFKWVSTTALSLNGIADLVRGGYEGSELGTLYIGRAYVNNQLTIGKVVGYHIGDGQEDLNVLFVASDSKELKFEQYEVLTYAEPPSQ